MKRALTHRPHRVLGICHFPTFYQAMDATQHIVKLGNADGVSPDADALPTGSSRDGRLLVKRLR